MTMTTTLSQVRQALSGCKTLLLPILFFLSAPVFSQSNVFNGEPVQWVGRPNGYSTTPYNSDYRTLGYRRISTTANNTTDGRGQWATTINVQSSGGNIAPDNMPGGGGAGWLLISGPVSNRFQNKWNFNGVAQATLNVINSVTKQSGGNDMGLNMGTAGYYTFVFRDAGYVNSEVYIAYTQNAPVQPLVTGQSFNPLTFGSVIGISTGATPSTGENIYVRYRVGNNDFTTGTSLVQATGSGTNWSAEIPQQTCGATVYYYVFTSTRSLADLNASSEQERSLSAIRYDDVFGANRSYSVSPNPTAGITNNSGTTVLTCTQTSISVTATGGVSYAWDGGLGNNASASISSPGTYTVTVTGANGCTATSSISITQDITAPTAGITNNTGTTLLTCAVTNISLTATGGGTYSWDGGLGNNANATVSSPGTYTVTVTGANGCTDDESIVITQNIQSPNAGITNNSGTTVLTCTQTSIDVTATGTGLALIYSWDGGTSPNSAANSFTTPGTYTVTVTRSLTGCSDTESITITQDISTPTAGITNNSGTTVLTCTQTSISVTATGGVSYSWSGGLGNAASATITTPGNYTVTVTGANDCTATASINITQNIIVPGSTTVSGATNVCPFLGNATPVTYTASAAGASTYTWQVPANVNIISGQGTANLTVTFNAGFATQANKQIRVTASNDCGNNALVIYYLLAQFPNTPAPIVASTTDVCPSIGTNVPITCTIPKAAGATSYIWTAQAGTTTITHPNGLGVNDTTVQVTFTNGFTTSAITVQSVNSCGTSGTRSFTITRANPSTPSLISGPTNVCAFIAPLGTAATYTIPQQPNVTSYTWTLPVGATSISGQGTNTISFIYPAGYTGGSISVVATNGCGTSSSPRTLSISTLSPSTPSAIDVINTVTCAAPGPDRVYTYSLSGMPSNATSVQWTIPAAGTLVSGQGTTSITVSYPATAVAGAVTATAVNNCGSSVARSVEVKLAACPPEFASNVNVQSKGLAQVQPDYFNAQVFPNPTMGVFNLKLASVDKNSQVTVRVLDLQGRELKRMILMPDVLKSFGSDLKPGTYMMEVLHGENRTVKKLIKW